MAYIGRGLDKISNVEVLDNITFDGSSTSFTLQKGGVNFTPSSANNILVSIDGVVQAGNFTCSGSTIDFGVAVSASSTCNFIIHYGVGLTTTPSDNSVTAAKIPSGTISNSHLATTSINSQTAEATIAGDDEVLIYDTSASALRKMTRTNFVSGVGGTNTPAFAARMSSSQSLSNGSNTKMQFDTEIFDTAGAYDHSSNYRFTVPSGQAGKYLIHGKVNFGDVASTDSAQIIRIYKNGSSVAIGVNRTVGSTGRDATQNVTQILDLAVNDYIEIYAYTNAGSLNMGNDATQNIFEGFKLVE